MKSVKLVFLAGLVAGWTGSAQADCWRDQRTGVVSCTNANSTPPTMQHGSGAWVAQQNPYVGRTVANGALLANDARKVIVGSGAVWAGSAANATVLGVPIGVPANVYGAYQIGSGITAAPGHYSSMSQNYNQANSWQPTQPPYYVPPRTQYQRMCQNGRGGMYPC